jgi:hypothetical protein
MKKVELFIAVAVVLYIVFFAHSPPFWIRQALSNVWLAGGVFVALAYLTLKHSQSLGILLLLAFLLTMTHVTEHLEVEEPVVPPEMEAPVTADAGSSPAPAHAPPPDVAPLQRHERPMPEAGGRRPVEHPPHDKRPEPVMSCNLEGFSTF